MSIGLAPSAIAAALAIAVTAHPLPRRTDPLTRMTFVRIAPGAFTMGSPASEQNREAQEVQHQVTIPRPFYLGVYEVTQQEWTRVMGNNPSSFRGCSTCPVERISYVDAGAFVDRPPSRARRRSSAAAAGGSAPTARAARCATRTARRTAAAASACALRTMRHDLNCIIIPA